MKKVLLVVNSDVGRSNTIGFRFGKIAGALRRQNIDSRIIARANYDKGFKVETPFYKNTLSRLFNAIHIYFSSKIDLRTVDVKLFDRFVLKQLKRTPIDFLLAHFGEYLPRSIEYLKDNNVKIYLDIPVGHDSYSIKIKKMGIKAGEDVGIVPVCIDESIKMVDELIIPSEFVKSTLVEAGFADKIMRIVPFGADTPDDFSSDDVVKRLEQSDELIYLFSGNVNQRKGVEYLLNAWEKANLSRARLIICGRIYQEIGKILNRKKYKNVEFTGFVNVKEYYKKSHVFVFPTLLEGSAKAVYEAMSYGLPIITTFNAGSVVVDNEDGFLIPIADSDSLANKIILFYNDREKILEMGTKAMNNIKKYSWDRYGENIVRIYLAN